MFNNQLQVKINRVFIQRLQLLNNNIYPTKHQRIINILPESWLG